MLEMATRRSLLLLTLTISSARIIGAFGFLQLHAQSAVKSFHFGPRLDVAFRCSRLLSSKNNEECISSGDRAESEHIIGRDLKIVVVGKIIIDKYGDPDDNELGDDSAVTVGGGGPQAAWGAAAALAVRKMLQPMMPERNEQPDRSLPFQSRLGEINDNNPRLGEEGYTHSTSIPPKQPVTFLAPIGIKNWTPDKAHALDALLLPVLENPPILVSSYEHITPTINIWHDKNEMVHWLPVDGSFGEGGADGLWQNRPSAKDILDSLNSYEGDIVLHSIIESGCQPTGKGFDALPLFDPDILKRTAAIGIEPIVFPDEGTEIVSQENGNAVLELMKKVEYSMSSFCGENDSNKLMIVTPDRPCYDAACSTHSDADKLCDKSSRLSKDVVVRNGADGSFINEWSIPSATLRTTDGSPKNPTGAGNAYSAAFVACRASGDTILDAASLATAVGAAVCEHEHLPPWSWAVLERIAEAALEVRQKVKQK